MPDLRVCSLALVLLYGADTVRYTAPLGHAFLQTSLALIVVCGRIVVKGLRLYELGRLKAVGRLTVPGERPTLATAGTRTQSDGQLDKLLTTELRRDFKLAQRCPAWTYALLRATPPHAQNRGTTKARS